VSPNEVIAAVTTTTDPLQLTNAEGERGEELLVEKDHPPVDQAKEDSVEEESIGTSFSLLNEQTKIILWQHLQSKAQHMVNATPA
jgi:hypothetical protein